MIWKQALLGCAAAVALAPAAFADTPATTTADLNMRSGPGTQFPVIAVLPAGSVVDVTGCAPDRNWCAVNVADASGWSSGNYLAMPGPVAEVAVAPAAGVIAAPLARTYASTAAVAVVPAGPAGRVIGEPGIGIGTYASTDPYLQGGYGRPWGGPPRTFASTDPYIGGGYGRPWGGPFRTFASTGPYFDGGYGRPWGSPFRTFGATDAYPIVANNFQTIPATAIETAVVPTAVATFAATNVVPVGAGPVIVGGAETYDATGAYPTFLTGDGYGTFASTSGYRSLAAAATGVADVAVVGQYEYGFVNGRAMLLEPGTHRIIYVFQQ